MGFTTASALLGNQPNPESQANGSLMRLSPLGVFAAGRPEQAAAWAREDSGLTHPHPVCRAACAAFVAALATAIAGGDRSACYAAAVKEASLGPAEPSVLQALKQARTAPPPDFMTNQGWVLIALQNAFYQMLHAASFEEGVVATVMAGGDTDTNAAIAGALLGAIHGRQSIPPSWRRAVLSCRPLVESGAKRPRPIEFWPVDAFPLAEALLLAGR
jgi:ADP-ribosylglycohydrolase